MKHKGLLILVILLVVIFFSTLIAGLVLTATNFSWTDISDRLNVDRWTSSFFWDGFSFGRRTYNLDENHSDDLKGIKTIVVKAVSERIVVKEGGNDFNARLSGSYSGYSRIRWTVQREGDQLVVSSRYPWLGTHRTNLNLDLQIPTSYNGAVDIKTVSGSTLIENSAVTSWQSLQFNSVSGSLLAEQAIWPRVNLNTVSGALSVGAVHGKLSMKSVSGALMASYATSTVPESDFDTVSGHITLLVPKQARLRLQYNTVSGTLNAEGVQLQIISQSRSKTEATMNGGGNEVSAKTVSGGLRIELNNRPSA